MFAEVVVDVLNAQPSPQVPDVELTRMGRLQFRNRELSTYVAPSANQAVTPRTPTVGQPRRPSQIKLLDLLTNRYHNGIVHQRSAADIYIELPASSKLHAGQQVRFVVTGDAPTGLVQRQDMNRGCVTQVLADMADRLHVRVAVG